MLKDTCILKFVVGLLLVVFITLNGASQTINCDSCGSRMIYTTEDSVFFYSCDNVVYVKLNPSEDELFHVKLLHNKFKKDVILNELISLAKLPGVNFVFLIGEVYERDSFNMFWNQVKNILKDIPRKNIGFRFLDSKHLTNSFFDNLGSINSLHIKLRTLDTLIDFSSIDTMLKEFRFVVHDINSNTKLIPPLNKVFISEVKLEPSKILKHSNCILGYAFPFEWDECGSLRMDTSISFLFGFKRIRDNSGDEIEIEEHYNSFIKSNECNVLIIGSGNDKTNLQNLNIASCLADRKSQISIDSSVLNMSFSIDFFNTFINKEQLKIMLLNTKPHYYYFEDCVMYLDDEILSLITKANHQVCLKKTKFDINVTK